LSTNIDCRAPKEKKGRDVLSLALHEMKKKQAELQDWPPWLKCTAGKAFKQFF